MRTMIGMGIGVAALAAVAWFAWGGSSDPVAAAAPEAATTAEVPPRSSGAGKPDRSDRATSGVESARDTPGHKFRTAEQAGTAFADIGYGTIPDGSRDEVDAYLRDLLARKAAALLAAEEAYAVVAATSEPEWVTSSMIRMGDLEAHMGNWLADMPHPPYLNAQQSGVYATALRHKADVQWTNAEDALRQALDRMGDDDPRRSYVTDRLAAVESRLAGESRAAADGPDGPG